VRVERRRKRSRRREETLLEQQQHQVAGFARRLTVGACVRAAAPQLRILREIAVCAPFLFAVGHGERNHVAAWKSDGAVRLRTEIRVDLRFHAAHDCPPKRGRIGRNAPLETLRIEHLQQRRVRTFVPIVRRRGKKEPMFDMRREEREQLCALRVRRVDAVARRRALMHLIDDQQVETPRISVRIRRQRGAEHLERPAVLEPIEAHDCARKVTERIGADAAPSPQFANLVCVDHLEGEAELLQHLAAPLMPKRRRAQDEDATRPVPEQHFLNDEAGFDRLAEADVVRDQQINARHVERAHDGVELVILDRNSGAERRLQCFPVGRRDRTPAHRVQKRGKAARFVETVALRRRKRRTFKEPRIAFELPEDAQFVAQPVVIDGRQRDQMIRTAGIAILRRR